MIKFLFTIHLPVNIPPNGVLTPEAWLTAVRVKDPVTGIERTNDPKILQTPRAIISCVASKDLPFAKIIILLPSSRASRFDFYIILENNNAKSNSTQVNEWEKTWMNHLF